MVLPFAFGCGSEAPSGPNDGIHEDEVERVKLTGSSESLPMRSMEMT